MRFVTWLLTYAAGLAVAAWLLDGIWFDGPSGGQGELQEKIVPLFVVALILGLVSTFIEPVIKLISLPFIILTLGFLLLVINVTQAQSAEDVEAELAEAEAEVGIVHEPSDEDLADAQQEAAAK